ncbi:hypothetical protein GUJ93_ZPchr0008g12371 [Zizania palustris]|uniref:BIRD-IDD transcription factor fourth C2HC zinc finger domain-containing protein n=1 Tax=Zizania palustris TaxID=103762 RepID=A0A8J5RUA4_ZIZPA|nr:hypothetical protein GUJ93_ZPchr0008g12371 [Zizania palustris]
MLASRRDSFITHRAFCDALAEESARTVTAAAAVAGQQHPCHPGLLFSHGGRAGGGVGWQLPAGAAAVRVVVAHGAPAAPAARDGRRGRSGVQLRVGEVGPVVHWELHAREEQRATCRYELRILVVVRGARGLLGAHVRHRAASESDADGRNAESAIEPRPDDEQPSTD